MRGTNVPGAGVEMIEPDSGVPNAAWEAADEPRTTLRVVVNGNDVSALVPDRLLLSDFLRDYLRLTALKVSCGEGACGACTIIIDGEPSRACTLLALQVEGSLIVTLEGMNVPQGLDSVQQLFQQSHALQCGYCTPGLLVTVHCMIKRGLEPNSDQVAQHLSGHLCRCTGYRNILTAVRSALGGTNQLKKQEEHG
jgi:aerobic-type carbon monoxide dehydrogenase small subunit (CoxS/CutS family)